MPQSQTVALPKRWPLVIEPENRDDNASKDAKLINCFMETRKRDDEAEQWIYKRPGLLIDSTHSESGNGYGLYNWLGDIYAIFGGTIFKNGTSIGSVDATGGVYRFSSTLESTRKLVLGNGVKAYVWDNTTLTQITDVDFPSPFVKGWSYLDGTTYVMNSLAEIYGSDIDDPLTWDVLNKIVAQIEPDSGVALGKQLVYTIAFKEWTTEAFFDAGNPTGSPLGTVQGAKINYGCANADSVQSIDDVLIWLSTTRSAAAQIIMMEGLKAQVVSTKAIERLLDHADLSTVYSWIFKDEGHTFYIITIKEENLTLAFDLRERMWSQWTDVDGNYLPIVSSTFDSSRQHLLQHESNGNVYYADRDYTNDNGSVITVDVITPNFDGGTRRRKHLNVIEFLADQTGGSELQVRYNDNDYDASSWTDYRSVDLSVQRPILIKNGTFQRRAYHLRHQSDTKLRLMALELQLDLGTI